MRRVSMGRPSSRNCAVPLGAKTVAPRRLAAERAEEREDAGLRRDANGGAGQVLRALPLGFREPRERQNDEDAGQHDRRKRRREVFGEALRGVLDAGRAPLGHAIAQRVDVRPGRGVKGSHGPLGRSMR
jgi:hypothetical protein